MSIENKNGKNKAPRRKGVQAFSELKQYGEMFSRQPASEQMQAAIPDEPEVPVISSSINDPKYTDVRSRFEKEKIPLHLMDYALGLKTLPARDGKGQYPSSEIGRTAALLDEHSGTIGHEMLLAYKAHCRKLEKDPVYAAKWKESGLAWEQLGKEGAFVIVPATESMQRATKDLSPMPPEILERVKKHPAVVNYTLAMFLRQMRDLTIDDERQQSFARYFAEKVEEKAFRENLKDRERSVYENAYWALLDLKVAQETKDPKRSRAYPEIRIRADEVVKHIADFIDSENIRRNVLPKLSGPERETTENELAARPTNLIRAIGDRLFVPTRNLPIDTEAMAAKMPKSANDDEESKRLPGTLRYLSRLLGKLEASADLQAASADRDIEHLRGYMNDSGAWTDGAQTGFDIINRSISTSLQAVEQMKEKLREAQENEGMDARFAPVFDKHASNIASMERVLLASQKNILSLWNEYHREPDATESLKQEAQMHLGTMRDLRTGLQELEGQLKAAKVTSKVPEIISMLDEYIKIADEEV